MGMPWWRERKRRKVKQHDLSKHDPTVEAHLTLVNAKDEERRKRQAEAQE